MEDFPRTLFPLDTNKFLVEQGAAELLAFANEIVAGNGSFLPQRRVFANKDALHSRRTVKLDPVAEFFLYNLIYENRTHFRKPHTARRQHFGYRFDNGHPIPPSRSYAEFKTEVWNGTFETEEFIACDIAAYFNGVYHHDLHAWFGRIGASSSDVEAFGKFLREINAGRSLDCLPQGLYPAKMIGNDFLRFVEESSAIRAKKVVRFMDDIYLFDDNLGVLHADFAEVQRLLGLKGLSINGSKTQSGGTPATDKADDEISELKKRLLKRRRHLIVSRYDDEFDYQPETLGKSNANEAISEDEIQYVISLLNDGKLSEEDAELILIVMRDNVDRIEPHLALFAHGFPHLAKNFYGLCGDAKDKEAIATIVLGVASGGEYVGEYQLFWFGVMLEHYLIDTSLAPDLINVLYRHHNATDISKAKILEIPDLRYGLPEMREAFLREGRSDWLSWASAVGSRGMKKSARNYLLEYFKNGSAMNKLIAEIIQKN
nr:antiviral reverse transcriptase Drt5 [Phyllobacterium sp. KW56]